MRLRGPADEQRRCGRGHAATVVAKALCTGANARREELREHGPEEREVAVREEAEQRTERQEQHRRPRVEGEKRNQQRRRDQEEGEGRTAAAAVGDPAEGEGGD